MANKTILMVKVRQILGYSQQGTKLKEICRLTGVSRSTIKRDIQQFVLEELSLEDVERLSDYELDMLFANLTDIQPDPRLLQLHPIILATLSALCPAAKDFKDEQTICPFRLKLFSISLESHDEIPNEVFCQSWVNNFT